MKVIFELEKRASQLDQLEFNAAQDSFWKETNKERTSTLKQIAEIKSIQGRWQKLTTLFRDMESAVELLESEEDPDLILEVEQQFKDIDKKIRFFELNHLLGEVHDKCSAILTINSGAGGTESMDWTAMLLRMYRRWGEENMATISILDMQTGDEAGVKSVTLSLEGEYIFGRLKTEVGVHRLVRLSPFDTNKRRHTSFASVYVYPDIEDEIDIVINENDLRIDTFRSSGAGGQHVNVTDSAIRITHKPSGIVVQCQNERSQHKNRSTAMKILKAALYEREEDQRRKEQDKLYSQKKEIAWGSQVRSYVLHPYQLVKDHRTNWKTSNTSAVLDGDLNSFIEASLAQNAAGK